MPSQLTPLKPQAGQLALRAWLEIEARRQGFVGVGVTDLAPFDEATQRARQALAAGRMEGMPWYTEERINQAGDLGLRFPWGRSLVALSFPYRPTTPLRPAPPRPRSPRPPSAHGRPRGRIAGFALGEDYHRCLDRALRQLVSRLAERSPKLRWHRFVDHGRAFDRAIAERAGLGFSGKNTQLITQPGGSYVLLASLVLNLELSPDHPSRKSCGSCRACLPSCPTGALLASGVIDAPRCISYLTIEHAGPIPVALRPLLGSWVFGCDLCQEACPINERHSLASVAPGPPSTGSGPVPFPDLCELLTLSELSFQRRFQATTMRRSGRERLARNAAIALGNSRERSAAPALARALAKDPSALVRGAAAWALGELGGSRAGSALASALDEEADPEALKEIKNARRRAPQAPATTRGGLHPLIHSA
ncbi:MAG: tRNA epoxyqueuosine(34) reductase QueG [Candidatus Dormibacteria bacterium]